MANTLAQVIDLVESELKDSGNAVWSAAELTQHIRRALQGVSRCGPRALDATLESADGVYEYSLAGLSGLLWLTDCWYPWDPAQPVYPAPRPERWGLAGGITLVIESAVRPDGSSARQIRVFYRAAHTISGLDGAAVGTLDAAGEELVVLGAAGYAALQRAQDAVARAWPGKGASGTLRAWGEARLADYRTGLEALRRQQVLSGDARGAAR